MIFVFADTKNIIDFIEILGYNEKKNMNRNLFKQSCKIRFKNNIR